VKCSKYGNHVGGISGYFCKAESNKCMQTQCKLVILNL